LALVVAGTIGIAGAQTRAADNSTTASELTGRQQHQFSKSVSSSFTDGISPQAFEGTWQGVWRRYRAASHTEEGWQTSLPVVLRVKVAPKGILSGTISTAAFQYQPRPEQNPPLPLGAPPHPVAPPPPPLPTAPPSGKLLNPRIDGRNFVFHVKDPDGKPVDFQLTLQAPDVGTLKVTRHAALYPEFAMKRIQ